MILLRAKPCIIYGKGVKKMNVKLDKYKSKYIILNDFSTWTKSWITLLEENREIVELYIKRDKEIERQNRDKGAVMTHWL